MNHSGSGYLQRQGILNADTRHQPLYTVNASRVHFQPVRPNPQLLGPDTPQRVVTVSAEQRVPVLPVAEVRACAHSSCSSGCH